ncbi:MAG: EAL domain-containing protein [Alphaproteobacteria bacterium]|nr:EAL domain-containing protein [Alphaproteobacteria bacterium]MBU2271714.1 EAL domain-containing protein [Alphaproteobacteria bacterium]MBU2417485.1 EAL domain-containing protein [Alphaproteobacteria bacterium]
MDTKSRLLGLAFASADVLLELDGSRHVVFALGAGPLPGVDPAAAWLGMSLDDMLGETSREVVFEALARITPGVRLPAVDILINCPDQHVRRATLRLFELPELSPAISCALTWEGPACSVVLPDSPPMLDAQGLMGRVRSALEGSAQTAPLAISFVEVLGLAGGEEPHRRATARIEAVLQTSSLDGASAGRLADERFAVVCAADDVREVAAEIRQAGEVEGLVLAVEACASALPDNAPPAVCLKALRFALELYIRQGGAARPDLAFSDSLRQTLKEAEQFRALVQGRKFQLQYQPIVHLETRATHHFEALARLGGDTGPAETIRMAEELGLIEGFDLAVAEKTLRQLERPGFGLTRVAINVSGASLANDDYVVGLLRMTAATPDVCKRLIVEVTETSAIKDLDGANRRLKALQKTGMKICLDDFGAGAASYDYLRRLTADTVKIDGTFVKDVASDRSRTLIAHLVKLAGDLGMTTIAEMVETEEQAALVQALGVEFGQGWTFGRPTAEPVAPTPEPAPARRVGSVTGWA